jgi:hypothetical protein
VAALAVAFGLAQAAVVVSGRGDGDLLSDDAFYYFRIAHNAASGEGFTFDRIAPTNGFHPLFAWLCVPIFALGHGSAWAPVRAAMLLLCAASAATPWVLYRFGRLAVPGPRAERAGALMALFWVLSPFAWLLPLRGCEAALSTLAIAASAWQLARMERGGRFGARDAARLGALVGLAGLARTDNILWAMPVGAWLLWRTRSFRAWAAWAGAAALVVSPWVAWSLARFGTLVQVSGAAKQAIDLFGSLPPIAGPADLLLNPLRALERTARFVVGEEWADVPRRSFALLSLEAAAALAAIAISRRGRSPRATLPIYALAPLHLGVYAWWLRHYSPWYFLPVVLGLAVLRGERLAGAPLRAAAPLAAACAITCAWAVGSFARSADLRPHAAESFADPYLAPLRTFPDGSRVGVWNAGRIGYFAAFRAPQVRVVNLDCVVNNRLHAALASGRYAQWLLAELDYIGEEPIHLATYLGRRNAEAFGRRYLEPLGEGERTFRVRRE